MLRRLPNVLTPLSALLCVYCAILAVVSIFERGTLAAGYTMFQPLGPVRRASAADIEGYRPPAASFDLAGFRVQRIIRVAFGMQEGRLFIIPYWFLSAAWGVAPALWLRRSLGRWRTRRAARRLLEGRCPDCGYDLRGTPERCPECGTDAARATPAGAAT